MSNSLVNLPTILQPRLKSPSADYLWGLNTHNAFQKSIKAVPLTTALTILAHRVIFAILAVVFITLKNLVNWVWIARSVIQVEGLQFHLASLISIFAFPILALCTLPFGFLPRSQATFCFHEKTKVWQLDRQTEITTFSGKRYPLLKFESKLHQFLCKKLGDIAWAETIWQSYKKTLLPALLEKTDLRIAIEKWLKTNCFNLGCSRLSLFKQMRDTLPASLHTSWDEFIHSISCLEHVHGNAKPPKKKIVILTNQLGEKRVSDAVAAYLTKTRHDITLIDIEQVKEPKDPFKIYSGQLSEPEIHSLINVKQNNSELASRLWYCCTQIKKFVPDTTIVEVINKVRQLQPTLILSTRWNTPNEAAIAARLNIPMRIIHCDFGFTPDFKEGFRNATLLQFYTPAADIAGLPANPRPDEIQVLGYPIREGIQKAENVQPIKRRWNVSPTDKVIVMMMGSEGASKQKLLDIISTIVANAKKLPSLQIAVVCGNNAEMQREVQDFTSRSTDIKFRVFGWVDAAGISDWYNMADLYIGKTGGATTAELIHMGLPVLGFAEYAPEENNLRYLLNLRMAQKLNQASMLDQIASLLSLKKESSSHGKNQAIDWKQRLDALIAAPFEGELVDDRKVQSQS